MAENKNEMLWSECKCGEVGFRYFCEIPKSCTIEHLLEINWNSWVFLVFVLIFFLLIKISVGQDFGELSLG